MASLEERVAAIERRLDEEAQLRAAVDRDLSDLDAKVRATHHLVSAISITQGQHTETLRRHTEVLADHGRRLGVVEETVKANQAGINHIIGLLNRIIGDENDEGGSGG